MFCFEYCRPHNLLENLRSLTKVGVKVFQFEARGLSLYLHLRPTADFEPQEEACRLGFLWRFFW